jgi:two-component system chemotaxis response regulator CheB
MGSDDTTAIPAEARAGEGPHLTGVVCPDCSGALSVRREGPRLTFRCRIGHSYATPELLEAKEQRLEQHMWSVVAALDELAALLRDLGCDPDRAKRATRAAAAIRAAIEQDEPVQLDGGDAPSSPADQEEP